MIVQSKIFLASCLFCIVLVLSVNCDEDFFLKAAKSVPRIGRRTKSNNEEFEKFFLKASKSVPRIGRREPQDLNEVFFRLFL